MYGLLVHDSGEAEVAKFSVFVRVEEDVAWFQISMKYFLTAILLLAWFSVSSVDWSTFLPSVAERECTGDLSKNFPYEFFADVVFHVQASFDNLL